MLSSLLLGIIALFIPPFPVVVRRGCGADLLINLLLTLFCWIPGVIHAFYIIIRYSGKERRRTERRYSSTSKGSGYRGSSSHARSRSRSRTRPRSSSYDRYGYSRYDRRVYGEASPPRVGMYQDESYYPPTVAPERPVYAYGR